MPAQLVKDVESVHRLHRALQAIQTELDLMILREPTGYPRTELTAANIHLLAVMQYLQEIS